MKLFESKKKIVEIGFSDQVVAGNWGAFQAREFRVWRFYLRFIRPTMSYIKATRNDRR